MHDDDAASCMEKSSIDFKVLTYKDFVPTFCEIADIWFFTNCQCDVQCLNVFYCMQFKNIEEWLRSYLEDACYCVTSQRVRYLLTYMTVASRQ